LITRALAAIRIAAENQIAVLGLEVFDKRTDSLATVTYMAYDRKIATQGELAEARKPIERESVVSRLRGLFR
jgi:hypothetical protein